jgi:hypothetical protein
VRKILAYFRQRGRTKPALAREEVSVLIAESVQAEKPFLAGRGGWMESYVVGTYLTNGAADHNLLRKLHLHAGVFPPSPEQIDRFADAYLRALASADVLGIMQSPFEAWLLRHAGCHARLCALASLEPYFSESPWSSTLAGRRVLVVHPFADSISSQYREHRTQLFANPRVLPEFEMIAVKAPQTMCGQSDGFSCWDEALQALHEEVATKTFDVAIVGCGSYGLPLAAYIKSSLERPVVQLGGSTQILFGISGARWRQRPEFLALMNEHWRPPGENERPPGWREIEGGCYW